MLLYCTISLLFAMFFIVAQEPIEHAIGREWAVAIALGLVGNLAYILYWVLFVVETAETCNV